MRSVLVYPGLAQPQTEDGFAVPDRRAEQFALCRTCGAVALESQDLHARWHHTSRA